MARRSVRCRRVVLPRSAASCVRQFTSTASMEHPKREWPRSAAAPIQSATLPQRGPPAPRPRRSPATAFRRQREAALRRDFERSRRAARPGPRACGQVAEQAHERRRAAPGFLDPPDRTEIALDPFAHHRLGRASTCRAGDRACARRPRPPPSSSAAAAVRGASRMSNRPVTSNSSVSSFAIEISSAVRSWIGSPMARIACAKSSTAWCAGHVAGLEMHLGDAAIVARDEAEQDFGEEAPLLRPEPAHDAEIDGARCGPARSTNRLPGCMSAWKKPSRSAWRRKDWITMRPRRDRSCPASSSAVDVAERDAVDPFHRQHVAGGPLPVDRGHAEVGVVARCSRPSRTARRPRAADPSPSSTERASVSTTPTGRRRRSSGSIRSSGGAPRRPWRRGRAGTGARRRAAAPSRRRPRSPPSSATLRLMHLRDRGGGDRLAEADEEAVDGRAQRRPRRVATASALRKRRHPVLQRFRDRARRATPTTSGRVARNWPSLT